MLRTPSYIQKKLSRVLWLFFDTCSAESSLARLSNTLIFCDPSSLAISNRCRVSRAEIASDISVTGWMQWAKAKQPLYYKKVLLKKKRLIYRQWENNIAKLEHRPHCSLCFGRFRGLAHVHARELSGGFHPLHCIFVLSSSIWSTSDTERKALVARFRTCPWQRIRWWRGWYSCGIAIIISRI